MRTGLLANFGLLLAGAATTAAPAFFNLGFLGADGPSIAYGVSPDGRAIVGLCNSPLTPTDPGGFRAFRWRVCDGVMENLGTFANPGGFLSSWGQACSNKGRVVAGVSLRPDSLSEDGSPAFWFGEPPPVFPGNLGGGSTAGYAMAVTPDGSVIVGAEIGPANRFVGFRWTQATGLVALPELPGAAFSKALGVSDDGSVIVGYASIGSTTSPMPVVWRNGGVSLLAGVFAGALGAGADCSADGSIIAGTSGGRAVRWVNGALQQLGVVPGFENGLYNAYACSADGSVIVGLGNFNAGLGTGLAFIWDETHGMRNLNQLALALGLMPDVYLYSALGISADGAFLCGYGFDANEAQTAWALRLSGTGEPACPGDADENGVVNFGDLNLVLSAFGQQGRCDAIPGDVNGDGFVNFADLNLVLSNFGGGC